MVSLFVATPMYGGQCYGAYCDSVMKLAIHCFKLGIEFKFFPIFNESHIDRARNVCADQFLQSGMTHLLFVDSDLSGYKPEQVMDLIQRDKDIICGFYPKKRIKWDTIVKAVKQGIADDNPEVLSVFVGDMVFTPALDDGSNRSRSIYELTELYEGGTGFMLVKREALVKIAEANPERMYHRHYDKPEFMTAFFDARCEPEWQVRYRRFITEDFDFCRLAREAGFKIWLAPWVKLIHHGYYQFIGDIEAIAMTHQQSVQEAAE